MALSTQLVIFYLNMEIKKIFELNLTIIITYALIFKPIVLCSKSPMIKRHYFLTAPYVCGAIILA